MWLRRMTVAISKEVMEDRCRELLELVKGKSNYPKYAICADGGLLCSSCCEEETNTILGAEGDKQWTITHVAYNFDSVDLRCDHCYKVIDRAFE